MEFNFKIDFLDKPIEKDFKLFMKSFCTSDGRYFIPNNANFSCFSFASICFTHSAFYLKFFDDYIFLYKMSSFLKCDIDFVWRQFLEELRKKIDFSLKKMLSYAY